VITMPFVFVESSAHDLYPFACEFRFYPFVFGEELEDDRKPMVYLVW